MPEDSKTESATPHRIQAAMVLFSLETALGTYVIQNTHEAGSIPAQLRSEIARRAAAEEAILPVTQVVQETYLNEVIDLAIAAATDRSDQASLKRLKRLVDVLDVFDIRNAVCHPNRPFPENFWHRMASLATDPAIDTLRFHRITDAFRCAVEGRLTPPPEGWMQQRAWVVQNNLPMPFDHEVTGLIARKEECSELKKRLANLRNTFVALVGPGGTGKTALCLEMLYEAALDPATLHWADEIVYVSAKTERLTPNGIALIADPVDSLDSVKQVLAAALLGDQAGITDDERSRAFDLATKQFAARRVLLCIDNLETLLRDHADTFEEMTQALPAPWRVLVTSRVAVNGANVLPLGPIKRDGALKLARDYASIRGAARLPEAQLERLVEVCDRNPLALRITIDSYAAGAELASAMSQTKGQILEFSYTTLVSHLAADAGRVLECLFGSEGPLGRSEMGHLLTCSPDQVAEAINSLLRTSLVTRMLEDDREKYTLSSSVRELLLRTPQNPEVRAEVQARLREQRRLLIELEQSGSRDPLAEDFVRPDAPAHVRALVTRIRRSLRGYSSRVEQLSHLAEVRSQLSFDSTESVLHRAEALLLNHLNDRFAAIESLTKAADSAGDDWSARLLLAEFLRGDQRLSEALEQTERIVEAGFLLNSSVERRNQLRLLRAHWITVLWLERHQEVLEATKDWRDAGDRRSCLAALRVSTLQRILDDASLTPEARSELIVTLVDCLDDAFRLDGYLREVVHEGFNALERLERLGRRRLLSENDVAKCAALLDRHLPAMCGNHRDFALNDTRVVAVVTLLRELPCSGANPLRDARWSDLIDFGAVEDAALAGYGYQAARISSVKPGGFAFARALDESREYYVHQSVTELALQEFRSLRPGQLVSILPADLPDPQAGRAWPARHMMLT